MTVIETTKDLEALSLTFVAEFDAPVERVWQVWADPRQLERWWGPPMWPATFDRHDFTVGGRSSYYMTGPDGEQFHGWWQITDLDAPRRLGYDDGFADVDGTPDPNLEPIHAVVTLESVDGGTRMTTLSTFASAASLAQMEEMGMEEGMRSAMGQIDELLRSVPAS